ncbi:MAG: methyltransferase domain-containing protein [Clostridiales bacterium]|nr:methyltransferase domain-containing protein [Clostridiales bacterium]
MSEIIEKMEDFFAARADGYDEHMLCEVEGCREGYKLMAQLVPSGAHSLLDLGCGTGLELDEIFSVMPDIDVTGIDLTQEMLDRLLAKHPERSLHLICASYFDTQLGESMYDCAVSFQTMHHFSHASKTALYKKIFRSLKENGIYIECDYMVEEQSEEDFWYSENERIRREQNIPADAFYHYDTPCTVSNQISMLLEAGFTRAEKVFRMENTTIIVAYKAAR